MKTNAVSLVIGLALSVAVSHAQQTTEKPLRLPVPGPSVAWAKVGKLEKGEDVVFAGFLPGESVADFLRYNYVLPELIIRDDGIEPDEKAHDGIYTGLVPEGALADAQSFLKPAEATTKSNDSAATIRTVFRDRAAIRFSEASISTLDARFSAKDFGFAPTAVSDQVLYGTALVIRDLHVVEDSTRVFDPFADLGGGSHGTPDGAWAFPHLMKKIVEKRTTGDGVMLAATADPAAFVEAWLHLFEAPHTINGDLAAPRPQVTQALLNNWPRTKSGTIDLDQAPFRLMAIFNRIDLRDAPSAKTNAGELRFVFGALNPSNGTPLNMTVIFEFAVQATNLADWGKKWIALGNLPLGTAAEKEAYRVQLAEMTEQIVAAPGADARGFLQQLRTNEIVGGVPWELREFVVNNALQLEQVTVKQTAQRTHNNTALIKTYLDRNLAQLNQPTEKHIVPQTFDGVPFLAAVSQAPGDPLTDGGFWRAPGLAGKHVNPRHRFSLFACNGCHTSETDTVFTHVGDRGTRTAGQMAIVSQFVQQTGFPGTPLQVDDPAGLGAAQFEHNEPDRRLKSLDSAARGVIGQLFHNIVSSPH